VLAVHRKHPKQLSNVLERYYEEVDAILGPKGRAHRDDAWTRYKKASASSRAAMAGGYAGNIVRYDLSRACWMTSQEAITLPRPGASALNRLRNRLTRRLRS
jgi:hypothetical protein